MPVHNTSGGSSIFFAKTPDFNLLCSVVCHLENHASESGSSGIRNPCVSKSQDKNKAGQSNVLKCRELIFTESSVLASPSVQEEGNIYVIITSDFWQSGKFHERCQKMKLQIGKPIRVISAVFQACFTYTLKAKLAPLWNKAGDYYIQGRDFITSTGILGAINLEANVTNGEICLALKPLTVRMPHCTLQDFGVCPPIINHFLIDINYMIEEPSIDDKWCYVLPSMKTGKVVSLTHQIPSSSPFKSYSDLRKYWKNNYGYRLPENGEGIVYINVFFPAIPGMIFTYPEFCIRKVETRLVPRVDSTPVLQAFLTDIKKKMPHMCHTPLEVTRKAQYTAVTMNSASGYVDCEGHSSMTLTNRKSAVPQRIPSRALIPVSECRSQINSSQPLASPYKPLTGHLTSIKSTTGYIIKTPQNVSPVLPPSQYGYPHDGTVSKDGRQDPHQGPRSPYAPLPYGSNTKVTPSRHHCHDHRSPHQSPYAVNTSHAMPLMQGSPDPQGIFVTPPQPYRKPAHNSGHHAAKHMIPISDEAGGTSRKKELPKSARNLNHTIFCLAAELRNQSERDMAGSPHQACMPGYRKEAQRHVGGAGSGNTLSQPPPVQTHEIPRNNGNFSQKFIGAYISEIKGKEVTHQASPTPPPTRPFVSIFNPKPMRSIPVAVSGNSTPQGPKIKPSFTPRKPRSVTPSTFMSRAGTTPTRKHGADGIPTHKPGSGPIPNHWSTTGVTPTHRSSRGDKSTQMPGTGASPAKDPAAHVPTIDLTLSDDIIPPTQPPLKQHLQHHLPHSATLQQQQYLSAPPSSGVVHHQPAIRQELHFGQSKVSSFKPIGSVSNSSHPLAVSDDATSSSSHAKKRKAKDNDDGGEAKKSKPRSKPKVQENIDVHHMAQNDQLSKVNSITLVAWLKEKGVNVTSRDKKNDLVAKVLSFINCTAKEM